MSTGITPRVARALLAALIASAAACGSAKDASPGSPSAPSAASGFIAPPARAAAAATYVGTDATNRSVAVRLTSPTTAVAYICDGAKPGTWFTGNFDATSRSGVLKSAKGNTLEFSLGSTPGGTVGGDAPGAFDLSAALPGAGLFRATYTVDGNPFVAGWIVGNDGRVVGSETGGKIGAETSQTADSPPPPGGATATTATPVANSATRSAFGCGVLGFRIQWNRARGNDAIADGFQTQFGLDCLAKQRQAT